MLSLEIPFNELNSQISCRENIKEGAKPLTIEKISDASIKQFIEKLLEYETKQRPSISELLNDDYIRINEKEDNKIIQILKLKKKSRRYHNGKTSNMNNTFQNNINNNNNKIKNNLCNIDDSLVNINNMTQLSNKKVGYNLNLNFFQSQNFQNCFYNHLHSNTNSYCMVNNNNDLYNEKRSFYKKDHRKYTCMLKNKKKNSFLFKHDFEENPYFEESLKLRLENVIDESAGNLFYVFNPNQPVEGLLNTANNHYDTNLITHQNNIDKYYDSNLNDIHKVLGMNAKKRLLHLPSENLNKFESNLENNTSVNENKLEQLQLNPYQNVYLTNEGIIHKTKYLSDFYQTNPDNTDNMISVINPNSTRDYFFNNNSNIYFEKNESNKYPNALNEVNNGKNLTNNRNLSIDNPQQFINLSPRSVNNSRSNSHPKNKGLINDTSKENQIIKKPNKEIINRDFHNKFFKLEQNTDKKNKQNAKQKLIRENFNNDNFYTSNHLKMQFTAYIPNQHSMYIPTDLNNNFKCFEDDKINFNLRLRNMSSDMKNDIKLINFENANLFSKYDIDQDNSNANNGFIKENSNILNHALDPDQELISNINSNDNNNKIIQLAKAEAEPGTLNKNDKNAYVPDDENLNVNENDIIKNNNISNHEKYSTKKDQEYAYKCAQNYNPIQTSIYDNNNNNNNCDNHHSDNNVLNIDAPSENRIIPNNKLNLRDNNSSSDSMIMSQENKLQIKENEGDEENEYGNLAYKEAEDEHMDKVSANLNVHDNNNNKAKYQIFDSNYDVHLKFMISQDSKIHEIQFTYNLLKDSIPDLMGEIENEFNFSSENLNHIYETLKKISIYSKFYGNSDILLHDNSF